MVGKILKGLAVAAGMGLAIGFGKWRRQATSMNDSSDNILALEPLLDRLDRIETRMSAVESRPIAFQTQVAREIPLILESLLVPHVEDVRARLQAEMHESVRSTFKAFEQTLDDKISARVATLEKALIDQSAIVTTLGQRALESEASFQRLISAVERLCESKERPALDLPFERQSGFRPRIMKEDEIRPRPRNPLAAL
jgi:hypothetical protein